MDERRGVCTAICSVIRDDMAAGLINRPNRLTLIEHQKYKRAMCQGTESIVTVEGVVIAFIAGGTANGSLGVVSPIRL